MRFLNTILLVLILIVACGGAAYYYLNSNGQITAQAQDQATTPQQAASVAPIFLALEPFTVTIPGNRSSQILYTEITLRLNDIDSHTELTQYMPEVRNRILNELAQHSATELQTTEGRNHMTKRLKQVISVPYLPRVNGPNISSVLFTAFVIQ